MTKHFDGWMRAQGQPHKILAADIYNDAGWHYISVMGTRVARDHEEVQWSSVSM